MSAEKFPAVGHKYFVDFVAFRVELYFSSLTSLTYTGIAKDGSRGGSETVAITVTSIRDGLFLVTWQESDKTTVVHLEDYKLNTIITNITSPDGSFETYHGKMRLEESEPMLVAAGFPCSAHPTWADIAPAFSAGDIECMKRISRRWPVALDLSSYASVYANRDAIDAAVKAGDMPQDPSELPWAPLACWNAWYAAGCPEH